MRKRSLLLAAAVLLAPAGASAQLGPFVPMPTIPTPGCAAYPTRLVSPIARVVVDGVCVDLSGFITNTLPGKLWSLTMNAPILVNGAQIQIGSVLFDADPSIVFSVPTINPRENTTFAYLFATPIDEGLYTSASSDLRVGLTSGLSGNASVAPATALQPTILAGFGTFGNLGANLGVDLGTTACSVGTPLPGGTTSCEFGTRTNTFSPTLLNNLEVQLAFTQTGTGSVSTFTGNVTLAPAAGGPNTVVPEPATVALVGTGLLGIMFAARRKRATPTS